MPENTNGQDAQPQDPQANGSTGKTPMSGGQWKMEDLPPEVQEYIKGLRTEAKTHREAKEAKEREAAEAEKKRLAEAGEWEQLSKIKAEEAARPHQQKATELEKVISEGNAERIAMIPEAMRGLVPTDYSAAALHRWLNANMSILARKPAADLNAGEGMGGSGGKNAIMTDGQRNLSSAMGISAEAVAREKERRAKQNQ